MAKETLLNKIQKLKSKDDVVYFSGFCFTDNKNFAFFNVDEQFIIDNRFVNVLSFKLTENDLQMIIDRNYKLTFSKGIQKVTFKDYGLVERFYFNMFFTLDSNCQFYPVIEWENRKSNRLIVGLPEKEGKPIGILKTVK